MRRTPERTTQAVLVRAETEDTLLARLTGKAELLVAEIASKRERNTVEDLNEDIISRLQKIQMITEYAEGSWNCKD